MRAVKYDTVTGEIRGIREVAEAEQAAPMPPLPAGLAYLGLAPDEPCDPASQRVLDGKLVPRRGVTLASAQILVGDSLTVPVPAGANWTLDGVYNIGPKPVTFAQPGTHRVKLCGAYSGDMIITVTTLAALKAQAVVAVDARREALLSATITMGTGIANVYAQKALEVDKARGVLPALLNGLGLVDRAAKYPVAHAECVLTGDGLSVVLARFTAGLSAANARQGKVEALAQDAKRKIAAAATPAALAAASKVAWPA